RIELLVRLFKCRAGLPEEQPTFRAQQRVHLRLKGLQLGDDGGIDRVVQDHADLLDIVVVDTDVAWHGSLLLWLVFDSLAFVGCRSGSGAVYMAGTLGSSGGGPIPCHWPSFLGRWNWWVPSLSVTVLSALPSGCSTTLVVSVDPSGCFTTEVY